MIYVAGLNADFMTETDQIFGSTLTLAPVDLPEFAELVDGDGNPVYLNIPMPVAYPNLQAQWNGESANLAVTAVLAVSPALFENMDESEVQLFTQAAEQALETMRRYRSLD